jgi:hypothetical protein
MKSVKVGDLPQVGWQLGKDMANNNFQTCEDLQRIKLNDLQKMFGQKAGERLYNQCRGIDNTEIQAVKERKSVCSEINFGVRLKTQEEFSELLMELSDDVIERLNAIGKVAGHITLKLKKQADNAPDPKKYMGHGFCDSLSRSKELFANTKQVDVVYKECMTMFKSLNIPVEKIRGLGVQLAKLKNPDRNTQRRLDFEVKARDEEDEDAVLIIDQQIIPKQQEKEVNTKELNHKNEKDKNEKEKKIRRTLTQQWAKVQRGDSCIEILEILSPEASEKASQLTSEAQNHLSENDENMSDVSSDLLPSLEEVRDINEITKLLLQCMKAFPEKPVHSDMLHIQDYCMNLIDSGVLDDLYVFLKVFNRYAKGCWLECYEILLHNVQLKMQQVYDATLSLV